MNDEGKVLLPLDEERVRAIIPLAQAYEIKAMDIRSIDNKVLLQLYGHLRTEAERVAARRSITVDLGEVSNAHPAIINEALRTGLHKQLVEHGIPTIDIGSSGGHDCAVFARQDVDSVMLFIRNDGSRHNPEELMKMADFTVAANILVSFLEDAFCGVEAEGA